METISGVTKEKNIHFLQKGMNFYEVKKNKSDKSFGIRIQVDNTAKEIGEENVCKSLLTYALF